MVYYGVGSGKWNNDLKLLGTRGNSCILLGTEERSGEK
jgi:hypothetical protein